MNAWAALCLSLLHANSAVAASTPLIDAVKNCQPDAIASLLAAGPGGDVNLPDQYGFTPAMWAISRCDAVILGSLVKNGAALPKESPQFSPIIEAAKNGHNDLVAYLAARQYNVNAKDQGGKTALIWAATRGDTAKVLLDNKADVNAKDANGQTALIFAAQHGNLTVLTLLLAQPKLQVNQQDKFGYTALTWASRNGSLAAVQALLAAGADKTIRSKDGSSASDVALRLGKTDIAQALQ